MRRTNSVALLLFLFLLSGVSAEEYPGGTLPVRPTWLEERTAPAGLSAESAVLLDFETGSLLYEKNPDTLIPPASLTKLMTVHLALRAADEGDFPLHERVPVPEVAWASNQAPGSSLMFLGPGQLVSGEELLYGLAVSSGNDAAVAVATLVFGGVARFVEEMNREAARLGYRSFRFHEPAGLSPNNSATARELADFAAYLLEKHPRILDYFSVPSFTYPKPENFVNGHRERSITQWNRNTLLQSYPGADGFKTGFIEASEYNLIATAEREDRRLLAVLLGVPGETHAEGGARRAREASLLHDYGYEAFELMEPGSPRLEPTRVYGGVAEEVALIVERADPILLPAGASDELTGSYETAPYLRAPVAAGEVVGRAEYSFRGEVILSRRILARHEVGRDRLLGRLYDELLLLTSPLLQAP